MPQLLEMDRVVSYLGENGFLSNHSSTKVSGAGSSDSLQRRFDEAWLYARLRKASGKPGSLPVAVEHEALDLSSESWPVSFMLARYYARARDSSRTNAMANRFAALVDEETDDERLEYFRGDIQGMATRISRVCELETANRIAMVVARHFPLGPSGGEVDTPE